MFPVIQERLNAIKSRDNSKEFITPDGRHLHYLEFGSGKDVVLVLPGMGEPALKYWELATEIEQAGFRVFVLDHIGHGLSDHLLHNSEKLHVDKFETYLRQAAQWHDFLKEETSWNTVQCVGHSMGGLIGSHLAKEKAISRLVLSSPMFAIHTKGIPRPISLKLAKTLPETMFAPFQKEYNQTDLSLNQVTQSKERAVFFDELLKEYPKFKRSGVTNGWLATSLECSKSFLEEAKNWNSTKILMFQSGKDTFIQAKVNKKFARDHSRCELFYIPGAKHEVFMEKDELRAKPLQMTLEFLKNHEKGALS